VRAYLAGAAAACALLSACQTAALAGLGGAGATGRASALACLDYQRCVVAGALQYRDLAGGRYEASITRPDGTCVPLLLSNRQKRRAKGLSGRTVEAEGLTLVRLADGGPETLEVAYFDRFLSTGVCGGGRGSFTQSSLEALREGSHKPSTYAPSQELPTSSGRERSIRQDDRAGGRPAEADVSVEGSIFPARAAHQAAVARLEHGPTQELGIIRFPRAEIGADRSTEYREPAGFGFDLQLFLAAA